MQRTLLLLFVFGLILGCSSTSNKGNDEDKILSLQKKSNFIPIRPKKILVLQPINRADYGGKPLAKRALEIVEEWIELNGEFIYFPQEDLETEVESFVTDDSQYKLNEILDIADDHGLSAAMLSEIESVDLKDEGEETGFFRNRKTTTSARVRIRVYDVKTRKLILSKRRTAKVSEENTTLLGGTKEPKYNSEHGEKAVAKSITDVLQLLPKYAKRIDWTGKIAKIEAPRLYVDAGRITGIKIGQILKVYGKVHRVPNQVNDKSLGYKRGRFKGTIKIVDYVGEDGSVALLHSGNNIEELDHVELYLPRHN